MSSIDGNGKSKGLTQSGISRWTSVPTKQTTGVTRTTQLETNTMQRSSALGSNYKTAMNSVIRRSKAVPLETMFKTEVESVKQKNHRKDGKTEGGQDEEVGRWNMKSNKKNKE